MTPNLLFYLFLSALLLLACGAPRKDPTIYEISTRPWLYELSQKYGTNITQINQIPFSEFEAIKAMGIDYVWMMGVWELGPYGLHHDQTDPGLIASYNSVLPGWTLADVIGSPYAIVNFTCNPEIGVDQDLINLRKQLNAIGLLLLLDFVPNHTAYDCLLVTSNPEMYMRAPEGTPTPYNGSQFFPDGIYYGGDIYGDEWTDVAQLNYWNQETFEYMADIVAHVASLADGIRCDMSMLIINSIINMNWNTSETSWSFTQPAQEFWTAAISNAKSLYPEVIFLAECYWGTEQTLVNLGFDYVYDKNLLDNLASYNLDNIRNYITSQSLTYLYHTNHFVENHDEPRAVALFGTDYQANTAAMIAYTIPGCKFVNHGQEYGYRNKLDVHLRRAAPENASTYSEWWYSRLLPIINDDVFHTGNWTYLEIGGSGASNLLAWKFTNGTDKRLIVANFSPNNNSYGTIVLSDAEAPEGQDWYNITELMNNVQYNRSANQMRTQGLEVVIPSWNGQIFQY